ncbi:hypothetical protein T01_2043, partial [Trichinella spiralis]
LLAGCIIKRAGFVSISDVPTKIASLYNFFAISRQIRVCTTCNQNVAWETNPYLLNKRHLKFACAYLNTQQSSPSGTPLKRHQDRNVLCIIVRYSLKWRSLVQYFFVLGKSIFLHFPSNWNKFIKIVSGRSLQSNDVYKVPWETNPYLLNKWTLNFACAYLNTQEGIPSGTALKRVQDVRYSMKLRCLLR